jgi:hypothetical protein
MDAEAAQLIDQLNIVARAENGISRDNIGQMNDGAADVPASSSAAAAIAAPLIPSETVELSEEEKLMRSNLENLPSQVAILLDLGAENESKWLPALTNIRRLISIPADPPIQQVIDQPGLVSRLVELLSAQFDPALVFEACWCFSNIASSTSAHTAAIVNAGCIPPLIELLMLELSDESVEQALWAVSCIHTKRHMGDDTTWMMSMLTLISVSLRGCIRICSLVG